MKKLILLVFISIFVAACGPTDREKEKKELFDKANDKFSSTIVHLEMEHININTDSLQKIFIQLSADSVELALEFANKIAKYKDSVFQIKDSVLKIERAEEEKAFLKSPAGKIYKKHPEWSKEDCESVAKRLIWIGMDIEMVIYERGRPNKINTSNYGHGNEYQYCWDGYDIGYFYCKEDGIVTSYN